MNSEVVTVSVDSYEGRLFDVMPLDSYEQRAAVILGKYALLYPGQQLYFPKEIPTEPKEDKEIIVDYDRVEEVLTTLTTALENNQYPYNLDSVRVPQDSRHMPKNLELGTKEHAMFLFTVCFYMRGGTKSTTAVQQLAGMYEKYPELFVASLAKDLDPKIIKPILAEYGLGFHGSVPKQWVHNAKIMDELWDGNPINIYKDVDTYEPCVERIANKPGGRGFWGFQEKMVSMLTYYLMDEDLIPYFDFPPPVDLHLMRVSISNELVKFKGYGEHEDLYSEELLSKMRDYFYEFAVEHKINVLRLADAVWLLSQSLCGNQPGNVTLEPLGSKDRTGRGTFLVAQPVDINDSRQRTMYRKTCGGCPIESTCKFNIPGKYYIVQGRLIKRGERTKFPGIINSNSENITLSFGEDN